MVERTTLIASLLFLCSCFTEADIKEKNTPETICVFNLESDDFFDIPFPSVLRMNKDGKVDISSFPNPRNVEWIERLINSINGLYSGFGTNTAIYFRFSGPIDTSTLPQNFEATMSPESSVLLANVDEESPQFGMLIPIMTHYRTDDGFMWKPNTLAILPAKGFVLHPDTTYCAVVTNKIKDKRGKNIGADVGFKNLIDDTPSDGENFSPWELMHRRCIRNLEKIGINRWSIVSIALFHTMNPQEEMIRVAEKILSDIPPPDIQELHFKEERENYYLFEGHYYPNPVFQYGWSEGLFPYEDEGGEFRFDEDGKPIVNGMETMIFAISIPKLQMPHNGFPVCLYAHGTGGDYLTFTRSGVADILAKKQIAVIGIDNAMNGSRIPEDKSPELLFFNIFNIKAGRDNNRQAAVDLLQLERLVERLRIPYDISPTGQEYYLNDSRIIFMGHSQGGLNGSIYLALSKKCLGGYLSGTGGNLIYSITYKTSPINTLNSIAFVVGLNPDDIEKSEIGIFHPFINLIQFFIEPSDPVNYAPYWFSYQLNSSPPKQILQSEGMNDTYAPPQTIEALAVAGGLPPLEPVISTVEEFELKGLTTQEKPVKGNISAFNGRKVTAGFVQYTAEEGSDGHFVTFNNEDAISTWSQFLYTLANQQFAQIN